MKRLILLDVRDSVAVAVDGLEAGESGQCLGAANIEACEAIPRGHKIALADIQAGEPVIKYGLPIGIAKTPIRAGAWVHSHNLASGLHGTRIYEPSEPFQWSGRASALQLMERAGLPDHFLGFHLLNGFLLYGIGFCFFLGIIFRSGCQVSLWQRLIQLNIA